MFALTSGNDVILGLVQPPTMLYKAGTLGKMIIFPKSPQTWDINVRSVPRVPGSRVIMFESLRFGAGGGLLRKVPIQSLDAQFGSGNSSPNKSLRGSDNTGDLGKIFHEKATKKRPLKM